MEFGSVGQEQRVVTQLNCAEKWRPRRSKPSRGLLGTVTARGHPDLNEVALEKSRTSATYRKRLEQALAVLLCWVCASAFAASSWLDDPLVTNQVLCEWIQHVFQIGGKISLARHGILAVQTSRREMKGKLGRAWDALKSWQLKSPLKSRVPMPETIMRAFFTFSLAEALAASKDLDTLSAFSFAILVRLGFHCLLRPAEILKLTAGDVRLPVSAYEPRRAVIRLIDPKNRSSLGRFQFVMVDDEGLVSWLQWFLEGVNGSVKLWPGSSAKFTKRFRHTLARLGLSRLPITPGCLRPGGATRAFLEGASVSSLKYRGRWRQESSLEVYIQEAMSHLLATDLSQHEYDTIHSLLCSAQPQWLSPPPLPWAHYFSRGAQWRKNLQSAFNIFRPL